MPMIKNNEKTNTKTLKNSEGIFGATKNSKKFSSVTIKIIQSQPTKMQ